MLKGKASKVPGFINALTIFFVRFVPRRWAAAAAYRMMIVK